MTAVLAYHSTDSHTRDVRTVCAGFTFTATCPQCAGDLVVVNPGAVASRTEARAIVRCTRCTGAHAEWLVLVRMVPVRVGTARGEDRREGGVR